MQKNQRSKELVLERKPETISQEIYMAPKIYKVKSLGMAVHT